jgi:maltoporin
MKTKLLLLLTFSFLITCYSFGQISYEYPENTGFTFGGYGRVGVDWSFENQGSIGRRLNLNNMGSVGGRLEEQDYLELALGTKFGSGKPDDKSFVYFQSRVAVWSNSLSLFGNTNSSAPGGLTFALPELFVEAKNIGGSGFSVWAGSRLYRGPDVHIADYRYFNDHSGQGFGFEYKKTRFVSLFIASTDTSSTLPPYFYLNIATGTPSAALRHRVLWALEHDISLGSNNVLTLLAEAQKLGNGGYGQDTASIYNYPSDHGFVIGARLDSKFGPENKSYNRVALRYGNGIANGGDGGNSKTWYTFGAPNMEKQNYKGAYSVSFVENLYKELNGRNWLEAYLIGVVSKGGAEGNGLSPTFWDREVYNRKRELAVGCREAFQVKEYLRLLFEAHYAQRQDGDNDWAGMTKLSFSPTIVPTGVHDFWARPEIRLVSSVAFYNKFAQETLYSPYLQYVGSQKVGYYFGIKAEFWIWK